MTRIFAEDRGPLALASISSLAIHALVVLLGFVFTLHSAPTDFFGSGGVLEVDVVAEPMASVPQETIEPTAPPVPAVPAVPVAPPAPPAPPKVAPRSKPVRRAPAIVKPPTSIDGVRIASADDVRRRIQQGEQPKAIAKPAPPAAPPPAPAPATNGTGTEPKPLTAAIGEPGLGGSPDGLVKYTDITEELDDRPYTGRFRPDTPGYNGRIFGQVSVKSSVATDNMYGRIHMFPQTSNYRDYSARSLFGYSFQQRIGEVATRGFETGRVTTPGAYLMVTDLFGDGHYSTMSHTVIFAFPRRPPGGGNLWEVVEEKSGDFRLRGPGGSALVFDGRSGALRALSGFVVDPPGGSGTPPRVGYRGLFLRLESVGSNPFLRDRPATVVDASGNECSLSTSDLFSYAGRRESDVFKFTEDRDFFAFLRDRCDGLKLPKPAPTLMARAARKAPEKKAEKAAGGQGLLPYLMRGFR